MRVRDRAGSSWAEIGRGDRGTLELCGGTVCGGKGLRSGGLEMGRHELVLESGRCKRGLDLGREVCMEVCRDGRGFEVG